MKTSEYMTRTIFNKAEYPTFNNSFRPLAIDFGYSAVKGISPDMVYCFPSFAKKIHGTLNFFGKAENSEIYYRDSQTNEIWAVGASAFAMTTSESSNDSVSTLFGRNRYFSEMFRVISRTGIGIGLMGFDGIMTQKPVIQTGLPPAYLKSDAALLKEALSGHHSFDLKIGGRNWTHYEYQLTEADIKIMPQPMGTLVSITTDHDGNPTANSQELFKSRLLILDPGFGTLDTYLIKNKMNVGHETFDYLGMKGVLQNTADVIFQRYGVELAVSAMQKNLETGTVTKLDRISMKSTPYPFADILEAESKKVCMRVIEKIKEIYNYLIDIDYLVITGGTGAAWSNYIREYFAGMDTLQIISGNVNDSLPYIFANTRGYYMYLTNTIKRISV